MSDRDRALIAEARSCHYYPSVFELAEKAESTEARNIITERARHLWHRDED